MFKKDEILKETDYFLKNNITIREMSQFFHRSKTAIHKDLTTDLKKIDMNKFILVQKRLKEHKETRHLKGGESTRQKYQILK